MMVLPHDEIGGVEGVVGDGGDFLGLLVDADGELVAHGGAGAADAPGVDIVVGVGGDLLPHDEELGRAVGDVGRQPSGSPCVSHGELVAHDFSGHADAAGVDVGVRVAYAARIVVFPGDHVLAGLDAVRGSGRLLVIFPGNKGHTRIGERAVHGLAGILWALLAVADQGQIDGRRWGDWAGGGGERGAGPDFW